MGLFLWDSEPSKIFVGDTPISKVFLWDTQVRPTASTEIIIYKMNADSNGNLYVPVGWYNHSWWPYCEYDWNVSVDWWPASNYRGTWSAQGSITLSGYTSWVNYTITITPTTKTYWRALAYWRKLTAWASYLTEVVYDWSYIWYWESDTSTWDFFRANQYYQCTSLTTLPEETLPNWVTSIWSYFRYYQFYGCTSLTATSIEILPDTVTSIGSSFRAGQYWQDTWLNTITWRKDLSIGWNDYRLQQFARGSSNKVVTVLSDVGYPSYSQSTLRNADVATVRVPTTYLSNFTWASVYPRTSISDWKFVGY